MPEAELRTAADEFFRAVRALLELPEIGIDPPTKKELFVIAQHFGVQNLNRDRRVPPPLDESLEFHPPPKRLKEGW